MSLNRSGLLIRHVTPAEADQWRDLRVALWPEAEASDLASDRSAGGRGSEAHW